MNRLSCRFHPGKTHNHDRTLLIDGRPLVDLLEEAVPGHAPEPKWIEKENAVVVSKALKQSLRRGGEYCPFGHSFSGRRTPRHNGRLG
jgi:hypothetical protein